VSDCENMFRFFLVLSLLVIVVSCQPPQLPATAQVIINNIPNGTIWLNKSAVQALANEIQQLANLPQLSLASTIQSLVQQATSGLAQTVNNLSAAQAALASALQNLASQISVNIAKTQVFSGLVQSFGDAQAAVQLQCQVLQNLSAVATAALQDLTVAQINATLVEQQLLVNSAAQLVQNPASIPAFLNQLAQIRANGDVYTAVQALVTSFIQNNTVAIANCFSTLQNRTAALAIGLYSNYTTLKNLIGSDVASFNSQVVSIINTALNTSGVINNNIITVFDDVRQLVNLTIPIAPNNNIPVQNFVNTLQATLAGITGGKVAIINNPSGKRQIPSSVLAVVQGVTSYLNNSNFNPQTVYQTIQSQATSLYQQLLQQISNTNPAALAAIKAAIQKNLSLAVASVQQAQAAYQQQFQSFVANASAVQSAVQSSVRNVNGVALLVLQTRLAQIQANIADLQNQLQGLNASIPQLQAVIENIQESLYNISLTIANSSGNALTLLQAQQTALQNTLLTYAGQLQVIQASVQNASLTYLAAINNFQMQKLAILQNISDLTVYSLNATAARIQALVQSNFYNISATASALASGIIPGILSFNCTGFQIVANGVVIPCVVTFDNTTTTNQIISVVSGIWPGLFFSNQVTVTVSGNKRAAGTVTLQSQVSSSSNSPSSSSSVPIPLIAGVVGGVILIIIVVVIIVVVRKKNDDNEYSSMRA
jgi:hypothetical protein